MTVAVALRHRLGDFALDVAFEAPGGVVALFGHSGAGKTTVVNAVAGLLRPEAGRIAVGGETLLDTPAGIDLPVHRRRVGYVFQDSRLFPHLTVRQNLRYGRWFAPARAPEADFARIVEMLGIGPLLDRRPAGLSGGEKSRVAIGRALLSSPRLLLMDEPFASLDPARRDEILPYVERLRDETRIPVIYVSHALAEVARLADSIVVLERGRVVRAGPAAEVLSDPEAMPSIGVRDAGAILSGTVARHHDADGLTEIAVAGTRLFVPRTATAPGHPVRLRIAASDVMIALARPERISALNVVPARVLSIREGAGPGAAVVLDAAGERLLARITRRSVRELGLVPGLPCFAVIKSMRTARDAIGG